MLIRGASIHSQINRHGSPKQVLLGDGVLPDITQVAVATFDTPFETDLHKHPTMYEVYYFLEGNATYTVGDQSWEVCPGDLLVVPPNTPHRQVVTNPPHRTLYWGIAVDEVRAPDVEVHQ